MPTVVTERPYRKVNSEPLRKRWTRAECDALEKWADWDSDHLELIEGELIAKVSKNRPHANALIISNRIQNKGPREIVTPREPSIKVKD